MSSKDTWTLYLVGFQIIFLKPVYTFPVPVACQRVYKAAQPRELLKRVCAWQAQQPTFLFFNPFFITEMLPAASR